jgi:hypothetical protein
MHAAVVFMGRHQMKSSLKWMGAFWLSIAGKSSTLIPLIVCLPPVTLLAMYDLM